MDDRQAALQEKLERLLAEVAEVEVELSRGSGEIAAVPHYSQIESRAHALGRRLSRQVQQRQLGETAAAAAAHAKCPTCGRRCQLEARKRRLTSIDGPFAAAELQAHCPSCRRAFFPSADDIGVERA